MLTLDYKLDGTPAHYAAMDEVIRTVQFIRNTACAPGWIGSQKGKPSRR